MEMFCAMSVLSRVQGIFFILPSLIKHWVHTFAHFFFIFQFIPCIGFYSVHCLQLFTFHIMFPSLLLTFSLWRCEVGIQELQKDSPLGRLRGSDNVVSFFYFIFSSLPSHILYLMYVKLLYIWDLKRWKLTLSNSSSNLLYFSQVGIKMDLSHSCLSLFGKKLPFGHCPQLFAAVCCHVLQTAVVHNNLSLCTAIRCYAPQSASESIPVNAHPNFDQCTVTSQLP